MTFRDRFADACADGSTDIYLHLPTLRDAVVDLDAQVVVEIGVGGRALSTLALLVGVETTGGTVWSCDIDVEQIPGWVFDIPGWLITEGDSLELVDQAPRPIDLLFIDSEHTYEQTLAELEAYVPLVRSGGRVYLHDTGGHQPGVALALNEFCPAHGLEWTDTPACYGLGLIEIP